MVKWQLLLRRIGLTVTVLLTLGSVTAALSLITPETNEALARPALTATGPVNSNLNSSALVTPNISLTTVATGFVQPTDIANAGDDRLFVTERAGYIRIIQADGTKILTPFLDISGQVDSSTDSNFGLLGLTFHPDYANNGYF